MKKKMVAVLLAAGLVISLAACGGASETGNTGEAKTGNEGTAGDEPAEEAGNTENTEESTLTYGSGDYTRINPAMDEHCEINVLLFDGLTAHDADDQVVPGLAESWDYDEDTYTYTFHIRDGIKWHDGEPFTADDVKFTIEAIMDPDNGSENAPNYEDVQEITVTDDQTIAFKLAEPNVAFLEYMTMAILPKHLLDGEDMQESDFFRHPIGTGPYKLESWDAGQSIVMVKNEDYYLGSPKIDKVIFKIVEDDNTQAVQLQSGEIDMALLDPKNAQNFKDADDYTCYDMTTSDYRGIMFNFGNDYWTENKDIIPAVCYGIDRQAIIDAVLLGQGMPAYGPLQRNIYNDENVEHYDYNPEKAKELLAEAGWDGSHELVFSVPTGMLMSRIGQKKTVLLSLLVTFASLLLPVFGSDVDFTAGRDSWYDKSFFNKQNYMTFGVATDDKLRIKIKGEVQQNLFAAGSVLSGSNTIHEGCGAGVSMLTALFVADNLIKG